MATGPLRTLLVGLLAALVAGGCGSTTDRAESETSNQTPASGQTSSTDALASSNGPPPEFGEPLAIDNPYLALARRGRWTYEGTKDGEPYRIEVAVTDDTKVIAWSDDEGQRETETMVVRHRAWVDDELIEEAYDYFAQGDDGGVWYFGEDVDNYEGGEIVDNDGSWLAGVDGALPALLMPAEPEVGQVYYSEDLAGLGIVERDEILALDATAETPDGPVNNGLLLGAVQPDGTEEEKIFVPGVGEVLARSDEGEVRLVEWTPQGDGPDYKPNIDPSLFAATINNPYLPMPVGAMWSYEVTTAEGSVDVLEVAVTDETRTVSGVDTTVVRVTLTVDGEIEEVTQSWYAQDDGGAVWLFGEIDEGYEDGELVETTTWEAGIGGAQPGIAMPGDGATDEPYRVGYVAGEMEERARLTATDAVVATPAGEFTDIWVIENWSDLEPGVVERKHYAAGIGLVFADSDAPDGDTIELLVTSLGT